MSELEKYLDDKIPNDYQTLGSYSILTPFIETIVPKENWLRDDLYTNCMICWSKFTKTKRRHHCRYCGLLVCSSCATKSYSFLVGRQTQNYRVCDPCHTLISTQENHQPLHGVMAVASREGRDIQPSLISQQWNSLLYFFDLLKSSYLQVQKLSFELLIKTTKKNFPVHANSDIFRLLFSIAISQRHSLRHLSFELMGNLTSDKNPQNIKVLDQEEFIPLIRTLPKFILKRSTETSIQNSASRFLFNYIMGVHEMENFENEIFQISHALQLLQILSSTSLTRSVLVLVAGVLARLGETEAVQKAISQTGGVSTLMKLLSPTNKKGSIAMSYFVTQLLAKLAKNDSNLDSIFACGIKSALKLLKICTVSSVIVNVVEFIFNISSFENEHRLKQDQTVIPDLVSIFRTTIDRSAKLFTLTKLKDLSQMEHMKQALIDGQCLTLCELLIYSNDSDLRQMARLTKENLKDLNENQNENENENQNQNENQNSNENSNENSNQNSNQNLNQN
ncbi:arrestin domain-containing protein d [Anaeramoeba ignava]|uniref:Arrestin domain-containing protein d n=1 Tax=Anaeramoeba ignava TaxID=1746090 RepID=A0A9Q0LZA8_ANAIG|nr:arrestin domain-containing protein d [Anaeramoeba ignava]